jgi:hypothetical protein
MEFDRWRRGMMMTFAARCASWLLECRLAQGCWCYVVRWLGEPAKSSGSWDFRVGMRSAMFLCFVLRLPSGLFVEVPPKIQGATAGNGARVEQRSAPRQWAHGGQGPCRETCNYRRYGVRGTQSLTAQFRYRLGEMLLCKILRDSTNMADMK